MKVFVWRNGDVLRNYGSGLVVVLAATPEEAWQKLRANDTPAFYQLQHDIRHVFDERDVEFLDADDLAPKPGFPIQPEEFELADCPVLVKWGGD